MIQINSLTKNYGSFHLNVSFDVCDGEVVAMIGRNGSGKTTTFKALLGLTIADGGQVHINGKDAWHLCHEDKSSIGVVMGDAGFNKVMRLKDIERIMASAYPKWNREHFLGFATKYNLAMDKPLSTFSTGMNVLAKLDMALSIGATTLILDEPTAGLDVVARTKILDILRDFMAEGENHSILISSHISSDLATLADRILLIDQGKIIFETTMNALDESYGVIKFTDQDYATSGFTNEPSLKTPWGTMVLTNDREDIRTKHPDWIIEKTTLDQLMMILVGKEEA